MPLFPVAETESAAVSDPAPDPVPTSAPSRRILVKDAAQPDGNQQVTIVPPLGLH